MNITITGPRSVGKTTVSKLIAKRLGLKYISSDEIGDRALKKSGGLDKAIKSGKMKDFIKTHGYPLIKKVYMAKKNYVFDLSGGAFSSKKYLWATEEVRKIAKKKSVVVGLLPSASIVVSICKLFRRELKREHFKNSSKFFVLRKCIRSYLRFPPVFKKWTNFVIYTENKEPREIVDEIMQKL